MFDNGTSHAGGEKLKRHATLAMMLQGSMSREKTRGGNVMVGRE